MPTFPSVALAIALGTANIGQVAPSIAYAEYGSLFYELRSVTDGRGLGGSPAYCTAGASDLVMIVYTVRNNHDYPVSAQAIPRLVMVDPQGAVVRPDRTLNAAMTTKVAPYLRVRSGVLAPGEHVVLADVFVTPQRAVRMSPWKFRPEPAASASTRLPQARRADPADCT